MSLRAFVVGYADGQALRVVAADMAGAVELAVLGSPSRLDSLVDIGPVEGAAFTRGRGGGAVCCNCGRPYSVHGCEPGFCINAGHARGQA